MKFPLKFTVPLAVIAAVAFMAVANNQAKPGKFSCIQVAVETTATTVIAATAERNAWIIQNLGVNPLYCDGSTGVTNETGIQVPANGGVLTSDMWGGNLSGAQAITCVTVSTNQIGTGTANTRRCLVY